ncbi:MAG: hypothetical protein KIT31_02865 [Deltaproteobacteria bacterium]|nr:hypothetical protein [Deltaproteobacteria bacterium]
MTPASEPSRNTRAPAGADVIESSDGFALVSGGASTGGGASTTGGGFVELVSSELLAASGAGALPPAGVALPARGTPATFAGLPFLSSGASSGVVSQSM